MKAGNLQIKWRYAEPMTACFITNGNGSFIAGSRCVCAKNDHFCRDTGRKLSLARAMKESNMPKEERRVVWEIYRKMTPQPRW